MDLLMKANQNMSFQPQNFLKEKQSNQQDYAKSLQE